jgi:hypothetical protein
MYRSFAQNYPFRVPALISDVELFPIAPIAPDNGIKASAIWDTGATRTFISRQLGTKLNLVPIEYQPVIGLGGNQMAGLALLSIKLPNSLFIRSGV